MSCQKRQAGSNRWIRERERWTDITNKKRWKEAHTDHRQQLRLSAFEVFDDGVHILHHLGVVPVR
jgi:hypothetical protein